MNKSVKPEYIEISELLSTEKFDFIDAGCGTGGSISYCKNLFGLKYGIGFDLNEEKINKAKSAGYSTYYANILEINFPPNCVSYASMMDFLEHLPNMQYAEQILFMLGFASKDFLFIRHPNFDDMDYLRNFGLKLTWTDWSGHTNMMKISDFIILFNKFGWLNYRIFPRTLITDSNHTAIIPLDAPRNLNSFDQIENGQKDFIEFDKPLYTQYDILIKLNDKMPEDEWNRITNKVISKL
ncbi:MAG: class I SAM-dependent methyltransferase [Ignavibacteriales bacterium]|jgi:SAM-dependent methyltransferase|nr:MAG: class I SAM-dependent methyltransferase [Ignavibacteriales bacterium]